MIRYLLLIVHSILTCIIYGQYQINRGITCSTESSAESLTLANSRRKMKMYRQQSYSINFLFLSLA